MWRSVSLVREKEFPSSGGGMSTLDMRKSQIPNPALDHLNPDECHRPSVGKLRRCFPLQTMFKLVSLRLNPNSFSTPAFLASAWAVIHARSIKENKKSNIVLNGITLCSFVEEFPFKIVFEHGDLVWVGSHEILHKVDGVGEGVEVGYFKHFVRASF